jgi:hypothetical protein
VAGKAFVASESVYTFESVEDTDTTPGYGNNRFASRVGEVNLAWKGFDDQAQRLHSLNKIVRQFIRVSVPHAAFAQGLHSVDMAHCFDDCTLLALDRHL